MARDPFAAEVEASGLAGTPPANATPTSMLVMRVLSATAVLALLALLFAYYLPLRRAHTALGDKHRALNSEFLGTSEQLKKTTEQLLAAQSERDSLSADAKKLDEEKTAQEGKVDEVEKTLGETLSRFVKSKQISIEKQKDAVVMTLDEKYVFRARETTASPQGGKLLCQVAKAIKSLPVDTDVTVSSHSASSKVRDIHLRRDYPTTWQLTGARAAGAARALDTCGLPGERVTAAAHAHHRPIEDAPKRSTGQLRFVVTPHAGS